MRVALLIVAFVVAVLLAVESFAAGPPDVVVLDQLVQKYDPVPFDHKTHARMAEMWHGCETCHHRSPAAASATQPGGNGSHAKIQANASSVPACKECHEVGVEKADLHMPNLKGAYHRQCLNCHREWAHANACSACHRERQVAGGQPPDVAPSPPTVDDIVGRMHPPIPAPDVRLYEARVTPAVGKLVTFRHEEHTARYGLRCSDCHHDDNCARCHDANARGDAATKSIVPAATVAPPARPKTLRFGRTWRDSHGPCVACHQNDRCDHCHYDAGETPPAAFAHRATGQDLDKDHSDLACRACHQTLRSKVALTCDTAGCHRRSLIAFPVDRPGPTVTTRPAAPAAQLVLNPPATTRPATRPVIRRIRWGGS